MRNQVLKAFALVVLGFMSSSLHAGLTGTVFGTGGTMYNFVFDPVACTLSVSGSNADFNSTRFTLGVPSDPTPTTIGISWASGSAFPQTWSLPSGTQVVFVGASRFGAQVGGIVRLAESVKYKVTFNIPANDTDGLIRYQFMQGDTVIGEHVSSPGEGPAIIQFTDLDSADKVQMIEITYVTEWSEDPLHPGKYFPTNTTQIGEIRTVSSGTPTTGGSTAPAPATPKPSPPPVIKTPETPAPPVPTPTPPAPTPVHGIPVSTPAAKPTPNPTPSNDAEKQTNQISAVMDNVNAESAKNANAIIDAVNNSSTSTHDGQNAIIDAVNKNTAANNAAQVAQIAAANKMQGTLDGIRSNTAAIATNTAQIAKDVSDLKGNGDGTSKAATDAKSAVNAAAGDGEAKVNTAKNQASGVYDHLLDGRAVNSYEPDTTGGTSAQVTLFENMGSATATPFELNPMESDLVPDAIKQLVRWFRALVGWTAVLGLYAYSLSEIRRAIGTVFLTNSQTPFGPQLAATAIPIAGAPVAIAARVLLIAILAAACIAMPAALVQTFSTDWTTLVNTFSTNMQSGGSGSHSGVSFMAVANQYVPVATLFAVMTSYAAFEFLILPIQGIWQWTLRFLPL